MPRLSTLAVWLALLISHPSGALAQHRFDSWTTENGLPQNSVNDILQTRDGYLWLATHGGLVRFDGVRFVVFDRAVEGIESQRIRALHEDRYGTLWAATEDGMLIRHQEGRFTTYTSRDGLPDAVAARIEEDDAGALWITWAGAVTKFDGQRFVNVGSGDLPHGIAAPPLRQYLDTWWRHDATGLHAFVKGRVVTYPAGNGVLKAEVTGVNMDRRGNLWIRTRGRGVGKAVNERLEPYTVHEGLPTNRPEGMFYEGAQGDIWFSENNTGQVYRVSRGKHELMDIPGVPIVPGLRALYVDQEGSTWLGTIAAGLHRLRNPIATLHRGPEDAPLKAAYSILQDRTGAIWIGHGGLTRYAGGRFVTYYSTAGISQDAVTCLYEDTSGKLWVGTVGGLRYLEDGRVKRFGGSSGFLAGSVWAMHEDSAGTFWFATDAGLVKFRDGRFTRYTTQDGLSHDRVRTLFEDRSGALWVGTYRGVTRVADGVFTAYTEDDGFIGNQVRAFHEDVDGMLWIGTYDGGLYRLAAGRLTRYTRREGLHDNGVFQILEDNGGNLWMGSNTGIYRVSRRELNEFADGHRRSVTSLVFGTRDGLRSVEVNGGNQPSGLRAADGKLWFPMMGGVAVIDPAAVRTDAPPPHAVIEEFLVAGEPRDITQELRVPPGASGFDIRYTAPTFIRPEQVRFRYRLVGLDDEWTDAGDRRTASFYRIPPGKYEFVVIASNHLGAWHAEGQSLEIVVMPPFWRTWWFLILAFSVAATMLFGVHAGRMRRVQREQAQRSVYVQELIDSQERERTRISNEMHDSLGYDLALVKRRAREGAELALVDEMIKREFNDILGVAERLDRDMKTLARGLRPYHLDKIGLTKSIEALVREISSLCDLEVSASIAGIDRAFPKASEIHVYRIVQEGLSNIVKHSTARHARVTIAREARFVEIKMENDGNGLSGDLPDEITIQRGGFGLIGIRERVQLLGGKIDIESSQQRGTSIVVRLNIEDVRDG